MAKIIISFLTSQLAWYNLNELKQLLITFLFLLLLIQVYHHCAIGHRYDFLCPNYTLFDQTTFTCRFVNTVDCLKSENHFNRNDDLYVETTEKPENNDKPNSKKEKERNKRDEEEAIKSEASSRINESPIVSTQSTLTTTINYTTNSNHDNRSDNFSNKTKVKNKLDKRLKKVS